MQLSEFVFCLLPLFQFFHPDKYFFDERIRQIRILFSTFANFRSPTAYVAVAGAVGCPMSRCLFRVSSSDSYPFGNHGCAWFLVFRVNLSGFYLMIILLLCGQISRSKTQNLQCVNAGFIKHTFSQMEDFTVTCPLVLSVPHLISGSCSSPRAFGLGFSMRVFARVATTAKPCLTTTPLPFSLPSALLLPGTGTSTP